ncbi:GNAT family N-acetyltransferase [Kineococcus sp. R8]|uniref:GNAT family N-acetyltransferase n=1 Tax=Kineococcus siccus TaxID=2696567 RepID=UPI0014136305|nr:GNAT family N-acetyltransferase [Kineococcus siccus]NAZ83579.1 GNAT family N-acetyltransferase [Kineococcus siccus]
MTPYCRSLLDQTVATYLSRGVRNLEEVQAALERRLAPLVLEQAGDGVILAIASLAEDRVIGEVSLWLRDVDPRTFEVGFAVLSDVQGRGYAREAVRALLTVTFDHLAAHEVIGIADRRNVASASFMHRLGMRARPGAEETSQRVLFAIDGHGWQTEDHSGRVTTHTQGSKD